MPMMEVACTRCGQWRVEEVSDKEIEARLLANELMIVRDCDPCIKKFDEVIALEELNHPEWGF